MKFRVERDVFADAVAWAARSLPVRPSSPVLAGLLWAALRGSGGLHVLDFGGSLGSGWRQNRRFLEGISPLRWSVVEQAHFVARGRERFEDEVLRFYPDVEACYRSETPPDVVLFSSVLHYLARPFEILEEILAVASGRLTTSEDLDLGRDEFVPWQLGAVT